jgi:hypothetical protein
MNLIDFISYFFGISLLTTICYFLHIVYNRPKNFNLRDYSLLFKKNVTINSEKNESLVKIKNQLWIMLILMCVTLASTALYDHMLEALIQNKY